MISTLRQRIRQSGETTISVDEFNQLQAEWIKRQNATPLNEHTEFIFGRPNFWCAEIAGILRNSGQAVDTKAEAEQAATIHFLLTQYEQHGENWKVEAEKEIKRIWSEMPADATEQ